MTPHPTMQKCTVANRGTDAHMMREDQASKYRGQQSMYKSPHPTQVTGRCKKRTWTNGKKLVRTCSPHQYATLYERALCPGSRVQPGASAAICSPHIRPGWLQRRQPVAAPAAGAPSRQAQPLPALTASREQAASCEGQDGSERACAPSQRLASFETGVRGRWRGAIMGGRQSAALLAVAALKQV